MPWLEVKKEGIGLLQAEAHRRGNRYLSLNVTVDQQPRPSSPRLAVQEAVSPCSRATFRTFCARWRTNELLRIPVSMGHRDRELVEGRAGERPAGGD